MIVKVPKKYCKLLGVNEKCWEFLRDRWGLQDYGVLFRGGVLFNVYGHCSIVDRVLVIKLRTRYHHGAKLRKTHLLLAFIWVLCLIFSCVWIWNVKVHQIIRNVLLCSCITVVSTSCILVFILVRRHKLHWPSRRIVWHIRDIYRCNGT